MMHLSAAFGGSWSGNYGVNEVRFGTETASKESTFPDGKISSRKRRATAARRRRFGTDFKFLTMWKEEEEKNPCCVRTGNRMGQKGTGFLAESAASKGESGLRGTQRLRWYTGTVKETWNRWDGWSPSWDLSSQISRAHMRRAERRQKRTD